MAVAIGSVGDRGFSIFHSIARNVAIPKPAAYDGCPEIPGANGQGRTRAECQAKLADAIALILEDRRADGLRGVPTIA
jgi:hypothetical protein